MSLLLLLCSVRLGSAGTPGKGLYGGGEPKNVLILTLPCTCLELPA
jgi:hypothetical protein